MPELRHHSSPHDNRTAEQVILAEDSGPHLRLLAEIPWQRTAFRRRLFPDGQGMCCFMQGNHLFQDIHFYAKVGGHAVQFCHE